MAKRSTRKEEDNVVTKELLIPGIVDFVEEVDRPTSTRQRYESAPLVKRLLSLTETGRALRVHITDLERLNKFLMHLRHTTKDSARFRYTKTGDDHVLMWAEKKGDE